MIPQPGTRWVRKGDELVRQSVEVLEVSPLNGNDFFVYVYVRDLETRLPGSHVWHKTRDWAGEWDRL